MNNTEYKEVKEVLDDTITENYVDVSNILLVRQESNNANICIHDFIDYREDIDLTHVLRKVK